MRDKVNKITKLKLAVFYSLKARMLVSFGLLLIIALLSVEISYIYGVPFTAFKGELKDHEIAVFKSLNFVADLKKERLSRWIKERKDDSTILAKSIAIRELITEVMVFLDEKRAEGHAGEELWELLQNTDAHKNLTSHLDLTAKAYGVYDEIEIAEQDTGLVFASTVHDELGENVAEWAYFEEVNSSKGIFIHFEREDPRRGTHNNRYALHLSRAISLVGLEKKAVLIIHIDPTDFIEPMLHTGDGLGRTGEALLVNSDVKILANLKYALADGSNAEPLVYKINAKPAILAAQGKEGIITARDYRNIPVLAAYRHIIISPTTSWGLVVKEDRSEVFSHIRENVAYASGIGLFIILSALGIIYIIAGNLSSPINSLSEAFRKIETGNPEARADISASGEMGLLVRAFNSMADKVQNWQRELENEVDLRTFELLSESEERKRAQAEIKKSVTRFRVALSGSKITVFTQDRDLKYTWVYNPNPELSPESVIGRTDEELVPAEDALVLTEMKRKVLETGIAEHKTIRFTVEGRSLFYDTSVEPMLDEKGQIVGIIGVSTDITRLKKVEEELRETNDRLHSLINASPLAIVIFDSDAIVRMWNPAAERIFGWSEQEVMGTTNPIVPDDKKNESTALIKKVLNGEKLVNLELVRQKKDGTTIHVSLSTASLAEADEDLPYTLAIFDDITERKKAQELLEQKSRHIQQLLDALPCFALLLTPQREIVALNKVARELGGDIGLRCFETLGKGEKPCPWCEAPNMLESGEFKNIKTWGLGIYWDTYWIPLEKDLYLHFAFDITESKKAEEKIINSLEEKEVLLREVHHRVKNNLAVISSLLSLQSGYIDDKKYLNMFRESQSRIKSMSLVHEKLYQSDNFAHINVKGYVESLVESIRSSFLSGERDVKLNINIEDMDLDIDNLIPCGLIMNEILTNSFKHAFDGHDDPEITVTMKKAEDGNISLSISDNGCGLPDGYDISKPTRLGHKLIEPLIKQIGGTMEVNVENGTKFRIIFPEKLKIARAD